MRLKYLLALTALGMATSANAGVILTSNPGTSPYTGPAPTYDFDPAGASLVTGGLITTGSLGGVRAQPFGSTGFYWTVGPADGTPGFLDLSGHAWIENISFIWGSTDTYNTLDVMARDGTTVLASFTGNDAALTFPNGDQSDPFTNPWATLHISGADQYDIGGLRLTSTQNAFEVDNFAINGVPEPTTWAMMLLGFGAIGFAMRRRKDTRALGRIRLSYT
jgi:hypothetical protein